MTAPAGPAAPGAAAAGSPAAPAPGGTGPQPAAAPAPATPAPGDATAQAAREARDRLARGQPLIPAQPGAEPAPAATPGGEPAGAEAAAAGGTAPAPDAPGAAAEGGEPAPEFEVTLPGFNGAEGVLEDRGENEITLVAPDQETFERLNRLRNGYMDGQRVKAAEKEVQQRVESVREERVQLDEVRDAIQIDPVGFVLEHIHPERRADIAMQMFFDPQVMRAVEERLQAAENPTTLADVMGDQAALRILQADLRADRAELRDNVRVQVQSRRAEAASARRVESMVDGLIPAEITGPRRDVLFRDSIRDIRERMTRTGTKNLDQTDVQLIIADRFRSLGIELRPAGNGSTAHAPAPPARPAAGPGAPAGRTAQDLQAADARRRAVAAAAPAGAGAPAGGAPPNLAGKTTKEVIAEARKPGGLRRILGRT